MRGYPERTLATRAKWLLDTREDAEVSATEWVGEMEAVLKELANAPGVPVLTVECEPGYWSRGHYHEGTKPYIAPTAVWKLPIGTKLYTSPPAPSVPEAALVRDAAPDIWRVMCGDWREETVAIHNSEGWIADGLDLKKAAALVEAHNGSLGLGVEAVERKLVTVSRGLYQFVDGVKIERIEQEQIE